MRLLALIVLAAAFGLAACEDRPETEAYTSEADVVEALPAEDMAADAAGEVEAAPEPAPAAPDQSALPPDERNSEESVQPESETLFY
ncbi:MAG: hypothetical protein ACK4Z5_02965 [Brevundimonas sp.]